MHEQTPSARKPYVVVAAWLALLTLAAFPILVQRGCALMRLGGNAPLDAGETLHGLWVTRWDYRTKDDVKEIVRNASDLGVTDIYWQVRGQADAYYESDLEPWGELILVDASVPTFDPLALAVREAHKNGIRLHAWTNVMPLWKGVAPPVDPEHAFHTHPEWRMRDREGTPQALHDGYVTVNPVREDVHKHIVRVLGDIARRYDVDGIHLDYIRFVPDGTGDQLFPSDAETLAMYTRATGRTGVDSQEDRAAFRDWIRDRITDLVKEIRDEVKRADPRMEMSAAVWRRPDLAREEYLQDAGAWLRAGLIDRAIPMIYTDKDDQFQSDLAAWLGESRGSPVTPGIGIYKHQPMQAVDQILMAGDGYVLFAYSSLFESADPNQDKSAEAKARRAARLEQIRPFVRVETS